VEKIEAETPASVSILNSTTIQQSPGANLDDRLRDVPGFSLFRRSSSLVANPTTQGISLRGIGSSGAGFDPGERSIWRLGVLGSVRAVGAGACGDISRRGDKRVR
jgi:hypothetical protein